MGSYGRSLPGSGDDVPLNNKDEPDIHYKDLWEACAGPHANIPRCGEKVFYFPQGHAEQVQAYCGDQDGGSNFPVYDVPSKILCKVASVALKAEDVTDEVIAQITLITRNEEGLARWTDKEEDVPVPPKKAVFSFSKTLTPSDTSTHGGFSVPKRCADECFPGLDMSLHPPVQELVAKDLNGHEWHFRHIYRGQPKRHLLTSGWSTFVLAKKLVAGDACIFVRGENGELRVGVRHVTKSSSRSVITEQCMKHGILASAYHAISYDALFVVFHHPWRYPHFVVSYDRYKRSTAIEHVPGMRFRYDFEGEDYVHKRVAGTIISVGDQDPIRWPNSKWKCLMVRWDAGPNTCLLPQRLSPWEINLISTKAVEDLFRKSLGFPRTPNEVERFPERQSEVLQGQEIIRNVRGGPQNQRRREILFPIYPDHDNDNGSTVTSSSYSIDNGGPILFGVNLSMVDQELPSHPGEALSSCYHANRLKKLCLSGNTKTRSCTKVLKHGSALGRSVDVASFDGYEELIAELDKMFDFHGSLVDESSEWKVTYMDEDSDLMLLGDYDWQVFRAGVRKMFICPKAELDKMKP